MVGTIKVKKRHISIIVVGWLLAVGVFGCTHEVRQASKPALNRPPGIHVAVLRRDVEKVCELAERKPESVNAKDGAGCPLIHKAAGVSAEITRMLLRAGADPNARHRDGGTALHWLHVWGRGRAEAESIEVLLQHGASLDARDVFGRSPLHTAVEALGGDGHSRRIVTVWKLTERGADPNARTKTGDTPLHIAARTGGPVLIQHLLGCGADPALENDAGYTPLHRALLRRDSRIAMAFEKGEADSQDIYVAAGLGKKDAVWRILERDAAAVSKPGPLWSLSALHFAAYRGHPATVKLLLQRGSPIDARARAGRTALHYAAMGGNEECVRVLMEHGASLELRDSWPRWKLTPLQRAAMSGNRQSAEEIAAGTGWDALSAAALGKTENLKAILKGDSRGGRN